MTKPLGKATKWRVVHIAAKDGGREWFVYDEYNVEVGSFGMQGQARAFANEHNKSVLRRNGR